ncbi:MAG: succinate dehydrogenase cytochrome b subunit [Phycisphaerae bacterium]|nr:succinate dehydrogenase cytochrome b subunit [Gemmatimonadaceae bacterium]
MSGLMRFWHSTIGKKVVMAVTGIIGIGFVVGHMAGNLQMFYGNGEEPMYKYAKLLRISMPALYAVRGVLLVAVLLHILAAWQLTQMARAARPLDYVQRTPKVTTLAAKTMRWGGVLLLTFIIVHILQITLGVSFLMPGFVHLDPYNNLRLTFANPLWTGFYVLSMAALALHLYHGGWAVVRTLGVARPSQSPLKRRVSLIIAIVVAVGFAVVPIAATLGVFEEQPPAVLSDPEAH